MNRKLVFLYAGQGSQFYQMGRELYENDLVYKKMIDGLDYIAEEVVGYSVFEEVFREDKRRTDIFSDIRYSHPSIYMSQVALARSLLNRGIEPDYHMGGSLGEIVAAALATGNVNEVFLEILSQSDILKRSKTGGMIVVLDYLDSYEQLRVACEGCYLASKNYNQMYVISGADENIENIQAYLRDNRISHQRLPVDYAFHSPEMDDLKELFLQGDSRCRWNKIKTPIISCCENERVLQTIPREYFWNVIRRMVDFHGTIMEILNSGEPYLFVDLSFTGSQASYIRHITDSDLVRTYSPFTLFKNDYNLDCVSQRVKEMQSITD